MTFENDKKTFLQKLDRSKKGSIDPKIITLIGLINSKPDYYSTSSCSGRVYLWQGTGKKNETEWLNVSHDSIKRDFFSIENKSLVWLRIEPLILHIACRDLDSANLLLDKAKKLFKKSCLLSVSNKIIVEIRGSEFLEMPLYQDNRLLFNGDLEWLTDLVNQKLNRIWQGTEKLKNLL